VVAGKDHIRYLGRNRADPLLPKVPIGFVQDAHIATLRTTLVWDLSLWKGSLVNVWNGPSAWEFGGSAIIADGPVILARKDARVPVICVTNVTTVPGESNSLVDRPGQLLESACSVGISHVI
jgi:hypothetical protein